MSLVSGGPLAFQTVVSACVSENLVRPGPAGCQSALETTAPAFLFAISPCSTPSLQAIHTVTCEALLELMKVPKAMQQLSPDVKEDGDLNAPVLYVLYRLFVHAAPIDRWSDRTVPLVASLLSAATADLPRIDTLALQHNVPGRSLLDAYGSQLAPYVRRIAHESMDAPLLAAALAGSEFGQPTLKLMQAGVAAGMPCPPWVRQARDLYPAE
jgi:hypothetical protein